MRFYNFYRNQQIHSNKHDLNDDKEVDENEIINEINANLYEFFDETNEELAKCGFVQMYLRNPFDYIIIFCANSLDPINCLKDFIQKRYLGDLEE